MNNLKTCISQKKMVELIVPVIRDIIKEHESKVGIKFLKVEYFKYAKHSVFVSAFEKSNNNIIFSLYTDSEGIMASDDHILRKWKIPKKVSVLEISDIISRIVANVHLNINKYTAKPDIAKKLSKKLTIKKLEDLKK